MIIPLRQGHNWLVSHSWLQPLPGCGCECRRNPKSWTHSLRNKVRRVRLSHTLPLEKAIVADVHWIIEKAKEYTKKVSICFVDYRETFSCVNHVKL